MEQNLKELLLKDLCARLPYGVIVLEDIDKEFDGGCISKLATITEIRGDKMFLTKNSLTPVTIEEIRPYLRPMSSMTEEEKKELLEVVNKETSIICEQLKNNDCGIKEGKYHFNSVLELEFLLSHHFDFRGLIPMGLAFEAPEGMYKTE